ncbi:alpha/beta-hydrolase [Microthyrium microscopicum]|uniref:Alpha/beta-hydrolase n=1 Tax=Microthyrium microscopicum TaxID=703497 RepID=A0A6A6UT95_9PEZI|nr:alpha/beta-hydrolase [Microthyrium microscopicum]
MPLENQSRSQSAIEFAQQAEALGQYKLDEENDQTVSTQAVEAKFITAQDPVIITADGGRLPSVPLAEALKLNRLRDKLEGRDPQTQGGINYPTRKAKDGTIHGVVPPSNPKLRQSTDADAPLRRAVASAKTNPLFPPLPMYGPPRLMHHVQYRLFRLSSAILSFLFLLVIILGAIFTSAPIACRRVWRELTRKDPYKDRIFYDREQEQAAVRSEKEKAWIRRREATQSTSPKSSETLEKGYSSRSSTPSSEEFIPTEGGPDRLVCDIRYYARRVGLDCEIYQVETEDGFVLELFHLYNPLTTKPRPSSEREALSPDVFTDKTAANIQDLKDRQYPVLLIHGLLQSAGAYCCSDETSLAFYLAKSGLDVWLGNNRCGFHPKHTLLSPNDPRMWAWNIRQMGVLDLPALISRVLHETRFPRLALVAHSQGTTQTLVALAKEQRPDLGPRISLVCLLAPAAYAGPLIGKMYFKFMRIISPGMFRALFGIHAFIPFMMSMHSILPGQIYGFMGYRVFSFLFNWTDARWDRGLRDRFFQFSPVYVSAESMRWWLGRECFATQKCILATREEGRIEDAEDEQLGRGECALDDSPEAVEERRNYAWYDNRVPPMAIWVGGSDHLVDGRRLLRRFERGREPYVNVVHSKIIPEYEHLDVLWAMDAIDQVGKEVLENIWKTIPADVKEVCRIPKGCERHKSAAGGADERDDL